MGFTINLLIADEAAFIPEEVWNSVIPALAITRGSIWLLSTPFVKEGYYYNCFSDPSFTAFHTSSEDCPRRDEVFLDRQKALLTRAQYSQMYLGMFVDELRQFFSDTLIAHVCREKRLVVIPKNGIYYLGCDVARMDRDEFTYEIIQEIGNNYIHRENIITLNIPIPASARRIKDINTLYNFKKIYVDSGGMGITVCDILREDLKTKGKIKEINNASREWERDSSGRETKIKSKKLLKEELYNNMKRLLETGRLTLLDDDEVKQSLKSIQAEHDPETGRMKINGRYSHIVEGLIRAAWASKEKGLSISKFYNF